jgi:conjugative transfer signal peptidase TraF
MRKTVPALNISNNRLFLRPVAVAVFFGLALGVCWFAGLRINVTASLPQGLYLLRPGTPGKGEYAAVCLSGEFAELARERGYLQAGSCPSGLRPLLKQVAGLPGDWVDTSSLHISAADSLGRPLPSALRGGRIAPGMALLLAPHQGSFDGRYFGLVPLASLQRVRPLWAFNLIATETPYGDDIYGK